MKIGSFGVVLDEAFHGAIFLFDDMVGWCIYSRCEVRDLDDGIASSA